MSTSTKPMLPEAYVGLQGIRSERAQAAAHNVVYNRVAEIMLLSGSKGLHPMVFEHAPMDDLKLRSILLNEVQPNVVEAMWLAKMLGKPLPELFVQPEWGETYTTLQYAVNDSNYPALIAATRGLAASIKELITARAPQGKEVADGE